ncbi:MAG: hypothetical protein OHK0053_28170 [Microscillaceae bacterium]
MKLRASLIPKITQERIDLMKSKIRVIESELESENINELINEFAKETGKAIFTLAYF